MNLLIEILILKLQCTEITILENGYNDLNSTDDPAKELRKNSLILKMVMNIIKDELTRVFNN